MRPDESRVGDQAEPHRMGGRVADPSKGEARTIEVVP
jgi:hypothetical protein